MAMQTPSHLYTSDTGSTRGLWCRVITFHLVADRYGSFEASATELDVHFTNNVLKKALSMRGYVDSVRLLDHKAGVCLVLGYWTSSEDCAAARDEFYQVIESEATSWPYTHFLAHDTLETEEYEVLNLHPGGGELILSPCARMTRTQLRTVDDIPSLEALMKDFTNWRLMESSKSPTGFIGAQLFINRAGAAMSYVSFWSCYATLQASRYGDRGSEYDQYIATVRTYCKAGTDIAGRYCHQQFLPAGLQGDLDRVEEELVASLGCLRNFGSGDECVAGMPETANLKRRYGLM